jgi:transcriptional regulator with XRE-family HTH domain
MTVTNNTIALIRRRFRDASKPKINQSQLADHMGYGKAWVSKLMNKKIQNLTDDQVEKMEEFLGIRLQGFVDSRGAVAPMAVEISMKMKESAQVSKIIEALLELDIGSRDGPRWVETKDMTKLGQEIIRIAFANEDKPGKVASLVLGLLEK